MPQTTDRVGNPTYGYQDIELYVSATGNDTDATFEAPGLDNRNGLIESIVANAVVTEQSGTSPTLQLALQERNIATSSWSAVLDDAQAAITSGAAQDISDALANPVSLHLNSGGKGVQGFGSLLRVQPILGGTSTPTADYIIKLSIKKRLRHN